MKKNNLFITFGIGLLGLIILYAVAVLGIFLTESIEYGESLKYYLYKIPEVLGLVLFGMLLEHKRVHSIFKQGIKVNLFFLIVSIGLIILLIPPFILSTENEIIMIYAIIMKSQASSSALAIFAGVLLVKSLSHWKLKDGAS